MQKKYIYKIISSFVIFGLLFFQGPKVFAQSDLQDDCAIDINTTKIAPSANIKDFGIINYSDLLYIYNDLKKSCEWTENNDNINSHSYIEHIYTSVVQNKFLLDINTDAAKLDTAIVANPIAKKRYDKKIDYYSWNKWLNPEIIKEDFDDLWKFGSYTDAVDPDTCIYKWDFSKWLYDKMYNLCTMAYCIRWKITTKNQNNTAIKADYDWCKDYVDSVMATELDRVTDLVINYSAKMTNNNFDTYINKYYGSQLDKLKAVNQEMDWFINWLLKKITDFTHSCMW